MYIGTSRKEDDLMSCMIQGEVVAINYDSVVIKHGSGRIVRYRGTLDTKWRIMRSKTDYNCYLCGSFTPTLDYYCKVCGYTPGLIKNKFGVYKMDV